MRESVVMMPRRAVSVNGLTAVSNQRSAFSCSNFALTRSIKGFMPSSVDIERPSFSKVKVLFESDSRLDA